MNEVKPSLQDLTVSGTNERSVPLKVKKVGTADACWTDWVDPLMQVMDENCGIHHRSWERLNLLQYVMQVPEPSVQGARIEFPPGGPLVKPWWISCTVREILQSFCTGCSLLLVTIPDLCM